MTTLHASPAEVKPAAVILFSSQAQRTPRPFGKGLFGYVPTTRVEYSAADGAWWAAESARIEAEYQEARIEAEAELDAQYRDYFAMAAYASADWCEAELAECFGSKVPAMPARD